MSRPAVFLDKDGTLVVDVPYNVDPSAIRLMPGAAEALRGLAGAGFALVVISNQSGVARGRFPEAALDGVEAEIRSMLGRSGVTLDGFYYCPHHPAGVVAEYAVECECRKPRPGMIMRATRDLGLDPARSWMVGDILDDVEAGSHAGCRTVLVDNGGETLWVGGPGRTPDFVAGTLAEAAERILSGRPGRAGVP